MKLFKKMMALMIAVVMCIAMSISVYADASIKIGDQLDGYETATNTDKGEVTAINLDEHDFNAYNILNAEEAEDGEFTGLTWGTAIDDPAALLNLLQNDDTIGGDFTTFTGAFTAPAFAQIIGGYDDHSDEALALAQVLKEYCVAGNKAATAVTKGETTTLPAPGYYLVDDVTEDDEDEVMNPVVLFAADGETAEINIKAEKPTLDKKIDGANDADETTELEMTEFNTGSIGEDVPYVIKSKVPNTDFYNYYAMKFTDTLSKGLTLNEDTIKVTVGDDELTEDVDYIVTIDKALGDDGLPSRDTTFVIVLKNMKEHSGEAIEITYSANVNKNAVINGVGNPNTVEMEYYNNPDKSDEYNEEEEDLVWGKTPKEHTQTYVAEIKVMKVDKTTGDPLAGATFTLTGDRVVVVKTVSEQFTQDNVNGTYYLLKDGTYTTTAPTAATQASYQSTTDKYKKETVVEYKGEDQTDTNVTLTTGSDGLLEFTGLGAGSYTLHEDEAPAGYNPLDDDITFDIVWELKDGTDYNNEESESDKTKEVAFSIENLVGADEDAVEVGDDGIITFTIENASGAELPSTGGMGTTIIYIIGGIMVIGAGILLVTRRRMSAN